MGGFDLISGCASSSGRYSARSAGGRGPRRRTHFPSYQPRTTRWHGPQQKYATVVRLLSKNAPHMYLTRVVSAPCDLPCILCYIYAMHITCSISIPYNIVGVVQNCTISQYYTKFTDVVRILGCSTPPTWCCSRPARLGSCTWTSAVSTAAWIILLVFCMRYTNRDSTPYIPCHRASCWEPLAPALGHQRSGELLISVLVNCSERNGFRRACVG